MPNKKSISEIRRTLPEKLQVHFDQAVNDGLANGKFDNAYVYPENETIYLERLNQAAEIIADQDDKIAQTAFKLGLQLYRDDFEHTWENDLIYAKAANWESVEKFQEFKNLGYAILENPIADKIDFETMFGNSNRLPCTNKIPFITTDGTRYDLTLEELTDLQESLKLCPEI